MTRFALVLGNHVAAGRRRLDRRDLGAGGLGEDLGRGVGAELGVVVPLRLAVSVGHRTANIAARQRNPMIRRRVGDDRFFADRLVYDGHLTGALGLFALLIDVVRVRGRLGGRVVGSAARPRLAHRRTDGRRALIARLGRSLDVSDRHVSRRLIAPVVALVGGRDRVAARIVVSALVVDQLVAGSGESATNRVHLRRRLRRLASGLVARVASFVERLPTDGVDALLDGPFVIDGVPVTLDGVIDDAAARTCLDDVLVTRAAPL